MVFEITKRGVTQYFGLVLRRTTCVGSGRGHLYIEAFGRCFDFCIGLLLPLAFF